MTKKTQTAPLAQLAAGQCPVCGSAGSLAHFHGETFPVQVGELAGTVDNLGGERCHVCEEVFFNDASAERYAAAGDALVLETRRAEGAKLRQARLSLGLSQAEAGLLAGGGHNGFSRYENGQAVPVPAVLHLFQLLTTHPAMAAELPGVTLERVAVRAKHVAAKTLSKAPTKRTVIVAGHEVVIRVRDKSTATVAKRGHAAVKAVDVGRLVAAKAAAERPAKVAAAKAAPKKAARR